MTTVTGFNIIACPGCGLRYRLPVHGSLCLYDIEAWSDGRIRAPLYRPTLSISLCSCGTPFMPRECEVVARVKWVGRNHAPAPDTRTLWQRLRGAPRPVRPPSAGDGFLTEIFVGDPWHQHPDLPEPAPWPAVDVISAVAASLPSTTPYAIEVALRRELWRTINDVCRRSESYPGPSGVPVDIPGWTANLERLSERLERGPNPDWMEIGETRRQLGRFDAAIEALARVEEPASPLAALLSGLAVDRRAEVWLIPDALFDVFTRRR